MYSLSYHFETKTHTLHNTDLNIDFHGSSKAEVIEKHHNYLMSNDKEYNKYQTEEQMKPMDIKLITSSNFQVGSCSLVGCGGSYPLDFGNYWSIEIDGKMYPVLNMWAENFEEAINRYNIKTLNFTIINGLCIVTDDQIPDEWYMDKLFIKYNVHRAVSFMESKMLNEWYQIEKELKCQK